MKCNRGVTLLEVLFSIAIVTIGILGIMMTVVLAGRQASEADVIDRTDAVGRNAIREFAVRGMGVTAGQLATWSVDAAAIQPAWSYCLDPIFVATNGTTGPAAYFPAFDPVAVPGARMARVSLRPVPGGAVAPLTLAHAEHLFRPKDDLVIELPEDRSEPPVQVQNPTGSRQAVEAFSWFATISPKLGETSDRRTLSVVVCHRRNLLMPTAVPNDEPDPERIVNVEFDPWIATTPPADAVAQAGGSVQLSLRANRPQSDLTLRDGSWLMLAGLDASGRAWFGWYRVQDAGALEPGDTSRHASLFGRDWRASVPTQAVLMTDVVAVYEKTIRLNDGGMF